MTQHPPPDSPARTHLEQQLEELQSDLARADKIVADYAADRDAINERVIAAEAALADLGRLEQSARHCSGCEGPPACGDYAPRDYAEGDPHR